MERKIFLYLMILLIPTFSFSKTPKQLLIPMRDGIFLKSDLYTPKEKSPYSILLYRTPYGKEDEAKTYSYFKRFTKYGYAVVVQNVRGRYSSEGEFIPYVNEGKDGYDTIEWLSQQKWSDGRIGMFGLSYPGAVQWLAALENPSHLKAIAPAMSFSRIRDFIYPQGVFDLGWIQWIWENMAPDVRAKKNLPGPKTLEKAQSQWEKMEKTLTQKLPLLSLSKVIKVAPYFKKWLETPYDSTEWDFGDIYKQLKNVHAAVLNLSGWYDDSTGPWGALENFLSLEELRKNKTDTRNFLILGPWSHGVFETQKTSTGELDFGKDAAIDYDGLIINFMNRYLKNIEPSTPLPKVQYFTMGKNKWTYTDTWPAKPETYKKFFFPSEHDASYFFSDPKNPVLDFKKTTQGPYDLSHLSKRKDVLCFNFPILKKEQEITGNILFKLFVSSDASDWDLWVRILDVHPDGRAYNLMSPAREMLRASYRLGYYKKMEPNEIVTLDYTHPITSHTFKKGHKMQICMHATYFPSFSRNLQTGKHESISNKFNKAKIKIYHSQKYPSHLSLPIIHQN